MIEVRDLFFKLKKQGIKNFSGVPDSVLKYFTNYLDRIKTINHITCSNEGGAVANAIGEYLSKKKLSCVYMQNSGMGNAINPLISIAHKDIYSIPMILLIGWRGSPKVKDEAQHKKQGKITLKLLKLLDIKYLILNKNKDLKNISNIINFSKRNKIPVALIIKNNVLKFSRYTLEQSDKINNVKNKKIDRSNFINILLKNTKKKKYKIVSTTGYISRDLYRLTKDKSKNRKNFYMIGGMGHAQMVAYGYANSSPNTNTICLDGDGSLLMHLGSSVLLGNYKKNNLKYILLNNGVHESVGGQYCFSQKIDFKKFSKSIGYKNYFIINKESQINKVLISFLNKKNSSFLEVKLNKYGEKNLPRVRHLDNIIKNFMSNK